MSMTDVILYSYFRSSCSWRVRIALRYKEIAYETRHVNLIKDGGQNNSEEFKKLNPMGQIPAIVIDGHTLAQSISILEYLEETRPQKPLLPPLSEPLKRAKVREICEIICSGIQPLQNIAVLQRLDESKRAEWAKTCIEKGFSALEVILNKSSGTYCVGNQFTLADCCLAPQVYNATRYQVDVSKYPKIRAINETILKMDSVRASHPHSEADCPVELKGQL